MFRDREQLSALTRPAERQEDWVDFPPSPEAADFSSAFAEAAPNLPIPVEPSGPNQGAHAATPAPELKPRRIRAVVLAAALLAVLGAAGYFGSHWWTVGRFLVSTDDAYVGAKNATLAAK